MASANKEVSLLTRKNQTTIPRKIREQKGLVPGDKIMWILNPDGTVDLQKVVDDRKIEKFIGILKTGQSTDEIMEQLRGPRN
jgi:bifunctional DNA-binding transcriptional regulator/antitoxin component of YhaV-PrlF toxin-antitoxin module